MSKPPASASETPGCNAAGAGIGCFVSSEPHEPAQGFTTTRQPRANGSDRYVEHGRNLVVAHTLQSNQEEGGTLFLGELGNRTPEVAQFKPAVPAAERGPATARCHSIGPRLPHARSGARD